MATPTAQNQEAFAIVREAALRADTIQANQGDAAPAAPVTERQEGENSAPANLPPPEVARLIPCKFFPNCRYGDRCVFHHPSGPIVNQPEAAVPPNAQPMFFPGPNGMPFQPGPGSYGVPPPFVDMNHPMFQMPYNPNGVPYFPPRVNVAPGTEEPEKTDSEPPRQASEETDAAQAEGAAQPSTPVTRPGNRNVSGNKKASGKVSRAEGNNQRNRANQGSRPSCAFFARSACRYNNDCRFPHILPDGTDARQLPADSDSKLGKNSPRRANGNATHTRSGSDGEGASSGSSTPQPGSKKTNVRRALASNGTRGKGARRGGAVMSHTNRKTVQRVPNSDEFPALPGGSSNESATSNSDKPAKVNFSAILSAPAPPKASKPPTPQTETPNKSDEHDAAEGSAPAKEDASQSESAPARDFAGIAAPSQDVISA